MKVLLLVLLLSLTALFYVAPQFSPAPEASPQIAPEEVASSVSQPFPAAEDNLVSEPPPLVSAAVPVPQTVREEPIEYDTNFVVALEAMVHEGINTERLKNDLKALKYDATLADVAREHSADMAKNNYFAHEDNDGCASDCRLNEAGYKWRWVGENLFLMKSNFRYTVADAAAVIVQGWMGSEGHRKNILQNNFTYEGIGVVVFGDSIYTTELFSRPR